MSAAELVEDLLFRGWHRPAGWSIRAIAPCSGCGATIAWAVTVTGRHAPLDRDGTSHFATCPQADRFRRRRSQRYHR